MGDCQNKSVGWKNRVHHDKRELVDRVSSAPGEIDWPTIRSFSDFIYRSIKCALEANRRSRASS
jgi:hypothetical protein